MHVFDVIVSSSYLDFTTCLVNNVEKVSQKCHLIPENDTFLLITHEMTILKLTASFSIRSGTSIAKI